MQNKSVMYLGVTVLLLLVIAILVSGRQESALEDEVIGQVFLQELQGKVNDVSKVEVSFSNIIATVHREGDVWRVKEKDGHPADFSHVKKLILAMAELKTVEPKTRKSENYERLGVQDHQPGGANKLIRLSDASGATMVELILGTNKGETSYVRRVGDEQVWLVKGRIDTPGTLANWMDKLVLDVAAEKVKRLQITTSKKERIEIQKEKSEDKDFNLVNLPNGKSPVSSSAVNTLASNFRKLEFTDVYKADSVDLKGAKKATIELETFDGLKISADLFNREEKDYLKLQASTGEEASEESKAEAKRLSTTWASWVYEIPSFKAANLNKKMSDIVK